MSTTAYQNVLHNLQLSIYGRSYLIKYYAALRTLNLKTNNTTKAFIMEQYDGFTPQELDDNTLSQIVYDLQEYIDMKDVK